MVARMTTVVVTLLETLAVCAALGAEKPDRAEWMQGRWGIFYHSLSDIVSARAAVTQRGLEQLTSGIEPHEVMNRLAFFQTKLPNLTVEEWNKYVDDFDVEGLAKQLHQVGASWCMLAVGQGSGMFCAPNAVYDEIMGVPLGKSTCSRRDLILDMSKALKPYGIKMWVYSIPAPPALKPIHIEKFGPSKSPQASQKWERVVGAWSKQWGDNVACWWFDGGYYVPDGAVPPNKVSIVQSARVGNPNAAVTLNPGVSFARCSPDEDYLAGEADSLGAAPPTRLVQGVQWHMLGYLGHWWSWSAKPRFTDQQVIDATRNILKAGGAVTWDVPLDEKGLIEKPFLDQLDALNRGLKQEAIGK